MYVLEWLIVLALPGVIFWFLFPELRSNDGDEYQNNTRVCAETVRHESTYIILLLTRHNESINEYKTTSFTHRPHVSLARFSFCWWRHNRLLMTSQWPDNCDVMTWKEISNSLDIDHINGDIHGQSCKKLHYSKTRIQDGFASHFMSLRNKQGCLFVYIIYPRLSWILQ